MNRVHCLVFLLLALTLSFTASSDALGRRITLGSPSSQAPRRVLPSSDEPLPTLSVRTGDSTSRIPFKLKNSILEHGGVREDLAAGGELVYDILASATNDSFSQELCASFQVGSTVTSLTIRALSTSAYYLVPSCLTNASPLNLFNAQRLIIQSFDALPANLGTIILQSVTFAYDSASGYALTPESHIDWDQLWFHFSNLRYLSITNSGLEGTLPAQLPGRMYSFSLSSNSLTGSIPPGLLSDVVKTTSPAVGFSLTLQLSNNPSLSGPIPSSLFSGYTASYHSLYLDLASTSLSGTIPPLLFHPLQGASFSLVTVLLNGCKLSGALPSVLFPENFAALPAGFQIYLNGNDLDGSIPSSLLENIHQISTLTLQLNANPKLSGSLPPALFSGGWSASPSGGTFALDISDCKLSGTIPSTFLTGGLTENAVFSAFTLKLSNNQLTGVLPQELMYIVPAGAQGSPKAITANTAEIHLSSNNLIGPLPASAFQSASIRSLTLLLNLNPDLDGEFPPGLLAPISQRITVNAGNTSLSGSPPPSCGSSRSNYYFSNAKLDGTIPATWSTNCQLGEIDLSNNPNFRAVIPPGILNSPSLGSFSASNTPLTGPLPPVGSALTKLFLRGTEIRFCSASDDISTTRNESGITDSVYYCDLGLTEACYCAQWFASNCAPSCPPPPSSPASSVPQAECPLRTRPSDDFRCVDGLWTANNTASTPTLNIPSGAGTVVVVGNMSSSVVIFHGTGSTIHVNGSTINLTIVTVEFDSDQTSNLGGQKVLQILVNTSVSPSSTDLSLVNVNTKVTSGCRKVKSEKATFDGGKTLGVYLSVDSSGCNTWWIILVSVVVAVIVIAVVILVLLAVFYPPFRLKIRPYSGARQPVQGGVGKS